MARTVTLSNLKTRILREADWEDSSSRAVDLTTELPELVNQGIGRMHEIILDCNEDHVLKSTSLNLTGSVYELPSDFNDIRGVSTINANGSFGLIPRTSFETRSRENSSITVDGAGSGQLTWNILNYNLHFYPVTTVPGAIMLHYYPDSQVLSNDSDELERYYTPNAIDEFIVVNVAMKILMKNEEDYGHLEKREMELIDRIRKACSKRDHTGARFVQSSSALGIWSDYGSYYPSFRE